MIKIENVEVHGWGPAIRGMRNPKNSWERSDSYFLDNDGDMYDICGNHAPFYGDDNGNGDTIGKNDHELMMKLAKGGPVHAKYRRMITVYVDITAPLYWWKEFDTYKVGTVANSCSTMHKIHEKEFDVFDFSFEKLVGKDDFCWENYCMAGPEARSTPLDILSITIDALNIYRNKYNETKTKPMKDESKRKELLKLYFNQMIQLLPSSYNQKRTVMLNYEVLVGIYTWRKNHKLDEWVEFCKWIEGLPYSEIITGVRKEDE